MNWKKNRKNGNEKRKSNSFTKSQSFNDQNERYEDNADGQKVIIYPNPTKGQLKIEIQGDEQITNALIYLYDLSGYSPGTYILKIIMGGKTSEWKIVKE